MRFEWDPEKDRTNWIKHDVAFEVAAFVFNDPFCIVRQDRYVDGEERWSAVGALPNGIVLCVAFTYLEDGDDEGIRIISARRASNHERRMLE